MYMIQPVSPIILQEFIKKIYCHIFPIFSVMHNKLVITSPLKWCWELNIAGIRNLNLEKVWYFSYSATPGSFQFFFHYTNANSLFMRQFITAQTLITA